MISNEIYLDATSEATNLIDISASSAKVKLEILFVKHCAPKLKFLPNGQTYGWGPNHMFVHLAKISKGRNCVNIL